MPEITLSLPLALGLMAIILAIGAAVVFFVLRSQGEEAAIAALDTPTATLTPTTTTTPTSTLTPTAVPSPTDLPPLEYTVQSGDLCSYLAAFFNVSIQSIVLANDLPSDCGTLYEGQKLLIPQPTPTASPMPTSTLSGAAATEAACEKLEYTVSENDTLSSIAANYDIGMDAIKEYNGMTTDIVYQGMTLIVPLCRRNPTPGPTPTATNPPPYLPANLLQPRNGEVFLAANETITLQWAAIGTMLDNEAYAVTIEDITDGTGRKITDYVVDTKYIIPTSFRPTDDIPHIIRWSVMPVRQTGTTTDGQAIWDSAGEMSEERVFSWWGSNIATSTPAAP